MKKEFAILFGCLCGLIFTFGLPVPGIARANSPQIVTTNPLSVAGTVSEQQARRILQLAAPILRIRFSALFKDWQEGKLSLCEIAPGKFQLVTTGGDVAVVVLDAL